MYPAAAFSPRGGNWVLKVHIMGCKKGMTAVSEWRQRFLKETLGEDEYHEAWQNAEQLQRSAMISVNEWLELTRLANAALVRADEIFLA